MKKVIAALVGIAIVIAGYLVLNQFRQSSDTGTQTAEEGAGAPIGKIKIATEGAYKPFNYVAEDGTLQGFDVDIAKALCEKMKAECEIVAQDWDGMIPGLLAKKYDAIVASMSITEERKQKINFSDKYYNTPARIVAKTDAAIKIGSDGQVDPASMAGMKIGVQRSTTHENFARKTFTQSEIAVYDTADNANLDLINGRIDARLDDAVVMDDEVIKKNQGYAFFGKGYTGGDFGAGVGVGLRKEDTALLDAFNKAIGEIRADGTYKQINDKYFSFDVYGE